mgnify:CR=1 FL=1
MNTLQPSVLLMASVALVLSACDREPETFMVGTLERDRIELRVESNEPIVAIHVRDGQAVVPGDPVLAQDPARANARLEQLSGQRDQAAARLAELKRGPRDETIREARANLEASQVQRVNALADLDPPLGPDYLPGGSESIPGTLTLTVDEYQDVLAVADGYNDVMERECTARGWAYVDVNGAFSALPGDPTVPANSGQLNRIFAWFDYTGDGTPEQNPYSAMTLDGVHPSEKGYAAIANLFAEALNATYGESYGPMIDVDAVNNTSGFEDVLTVGRGRVVDAVKGIVFTPSAGEVLRAGYGLE